MLGLAPKWIRLALNGINKGLFQIKVYQILAPRMSKYEYI